MELLGLIIKIMLAGFLSASLYYAIVPTGGIQAEYNYSHPGMGYAAPFR